MSELAVDAFEAENLEIVCKGCGACCQNVRLALNSAEVSQLQEAGTDLTEILPIMEPLIYEGYDPDEEDDDTFFWGANADEMAEYAETLEDETMKAFWLKVAEHARGLKVGQGLFSMNGRCGFLQEDNTCGSYNNRPEICRAFTVGGTACLRIRQNSRVESPVKITSKSSPVPVA